MGSYCTLYFNKTELCSSKSMVPDHWCALFQEADRKEEIEEASPDAEPDEDPRIRTVYSISREIFIARLELLGCSESLARERLESWIDEEKATWTSYREDGQSWADEMADLVDNFTAADWYRRAGPIVDTMWDKVEPADKFDERMRDTLGQEWFWFDGYGSLMGLRALIDAAPQVERIELDITELISSGWIEPDAKICEDRRREIALEPLPLTPTLILAEGSSDIRILQRSLDKLFPEFREFFSFFNHTELKVDGGSNYLVKFLKAFAAARTPMRMVAIFDNDTAGHQAFRQAQALNLPANMMAIVLPDIELARMYPTVGPQGQHVVNVNGNAASIELYLGRKALSPDGEYLPVRWTGYVQGAQAYHGEIEDKSGVEERFYKALEECADTATAREAFPELVIVWEKIVSVVRERSEAAERTQMDQQRFASHG